VPSKALAVLFFKNLFNIIKNRTLGFKLFRYKKTKNLVLKWIEQHRGEPKEPL